MITDKETNTLYVSSLLQTKYVSFHKRFVETLNKNGIAINYLRNTKDIWCRDFMPIQRSEKTFVQFQYEPIYLKGYEHLKSNPKEVWKDLGINVVQRNLVLDGGNVVKWDNTIVVTDRVYKDNPDWNETEICNELKAQLAVEKVIIIPEPKDDMTGHSDGILRFIKEDIVVINDFSKIDKEYYLRLKHSLLSEGIQYIEIPNEYEKNKSKTDDTSDHINFLEMENLVLVPKYGIKTDEVAMNIYSELFNGKKVDFIDCRGIAKQGGVLNCITWNIKNKT